MSNIEEMQSIVLKANRQALELVLANPPDTIFMWTFKEAPQAFKDISTNGGDEDWIALVPDTVNYFPFVEESCFDTGYEPQKLKIDLLPQLRRWKAQNVFTLYIGSHS